MSKIRLQDISTRAPEKVEKDEVKEKMKDLGDKLNELQNVLYAESKHSILVVLQGMDASGKDGVIRDVFTHMNPQGIIVKSFKAPTPEELSHDFLWRIHRHLPEKGMIQIFNRSHYEDILITRVHKLINDKTAKKRMTAINHFENMIQEHNNTHILKFYLHISREEQIKRLEERRHNPSKMWKYKKKDLEEAENWNKYMLMYEDAFENCNKPEWIIVPSDQNWYKEYLVANTLYELMKDLDMKYPQITEG